MSDRLTTHVIVSFWEVRIIDQSLHGLFPNHLYPFIQANPGEFTYNVWACDHMHSHRAKALHVSHLMSFAEQLSGSGNLFPNKSEGLESSADKLVAGYSACLLWWRIYLTSIFLRLFWFSILLHVFFLQKQPFSFSGRWNKQCASDSIWLKIATLSPRHWSHRPDRPGWPAFVGGWWNFPPSFPAWKARMLMLYYSEEVKYKAEEARANSCSPWR